MSEVKTFVREMSWHSPSFDGTNHIMAEITKQVTFKELDSRDEEQHKLHFKIMSLYTSSPSEDDDEPAKLAKEGDKIVKKRVNVDTDVIYDLTVSAIKKLLIIDETVTKMDKQEILADSKALLPFGMWFLTAKAFPFFHSTTTSLNT